MVETECGRLYTGISTEPERRLAQHKGELPGGAKFFRGLRAKAIVYLEELPDRSEASKREYQIKKLSKREKNCLIKSFSDRLKSS